MNITISKAIEDYLETVRLSRSENTLRTYHNAMKSFSFVLEDNHLPSDKKLISDLPVEAISWFLVSLKHYAPATERLYLTAITGFYEYLAAEELSESNLSRLRMLVRRRARKLGQRLPQFPKSDIESIIEYAINIAHSSIDESSEHLRQLRDCAFLLTLADTGLRVNEACNLRRGDLDWNEGKAIIIGKGNRQDIVRFSDRCMKYIKDYLSARSKQDGASGRPLTALPLFARHDRGAGRKIKPITTASGRNIVAQRVAEALGAQAKGTITPHSFRHYFVTTVLNASGGNLKLAQELARHRNIAVTQRYAHLTDEELDRSYWEIFDSNQIHPYEPREK